MECEFRRSHFVHSLAQLHSAKTKLTAETGVLIKGKYHILALPRITAPISVFPYSSINSRDNKGKTCRYNLLLFEILRYLLNDPSHSRNKAKHIRPTSTC